MNQKFQKGDRVWISINYGIDGDMTYFKTEAWGTVMGTYAELYGGKNDHDYKIYQIDIDKHGPVAWYEEHQLSLEKEDRKNPDFDLSDPWKGSSKPYPGYNYQAKNGKYYNGYMASPDLAGDMNTNETKKEMDSEE